MKRILLMSLAAVLLATSCTSNRQSDDTFALETREVDFQDKTGDVIQAEELNLEVLGVTDVVVYDRKDKTMQESQDRNPWGV